MIQGLDLKEDSEDTRIIKSGLKKNQPFDCSRSKDRSLPFDKLKAPSTAEGLRVDTERRF